MNRILLYFGLAFLISCQNAVPKISDEVQTSSGYFRNDSASVNASGGVYKGSYFRIAAKVGASTPKVSSASTTFRTQPHGVE